jgi:hypothetical protein
MATAQGGTGDAMNAIADTVRVNPVHRLCTRCERILTAQALPLVLTRLLRPRISRSKDAAGPRKGHSTVPKRRRVHGQSVSTTAISPQPSRGLGQSAVADSARTQTVLGHDREKFSHRPPDFSCSRYMDGQNPDGISGGVKAALNYTARCAPSMSCSQAALHIALRLLRRRQARKASRWDNSLRGDVLRNVEATR